MLESIITSYLSSRKRLLLLDYDGTLTELKPTPPEAKPTPELRTLLRQLASDSTNTVVVISGRKHEELQEWLGDLPIAMMAEHGLWLKKPESDWQILHEPSVTWKPSVRSVMEEHLLPGCLIEEKTMALVWHNANAQDPAAAEAAEQELFHELTPFCTRHDLKLMRGSHVIEVQPHGYDKGAATSYWLEQANWDFVLIAGDDTTDEDMFAAASASALTIHIGKRASQAQQRLATPADLRAILAQFVASKQ